MAAKVVVTYTEPEVARRTYEVTSATLRGTVSELALRRSEYSSVIKRDGFEALLVNLQRKIDELASGKVDDTAS